MCSPCMKQEYLHTYRVGKLGNPEDFLLKYPARIEHRTRVHPFCHRSGVEALFLQIDPVAAVRAVYAQPHVRIGVYGVLHKTNTESTKQKRKSCSSSGHLDPNEHNVKQGVGTNTASPGVVPSCWDSRAILAKRSNASRMYYIYIYFFFIYIPGIYIYIRGAGAGPIEYSIPYTHSHAWSVSLRRGMIPINSNACSTPFRVSRTYITSSASVGTDY